MNVERLTELADFLEKLSAMPTIPADNPLGDLGFNMMMFAGKVTAYAIDRSGRGCGTVACLAGWGVALKHNFNARALRDLNGYSSDKILYEALNYYGLEGDIGHQLFHPPTNYRGDPMGDHPGWKALPHEAARVVRHLIATGTVDWDLIIPDVEARADKHRGR